MPLTLMEICDKIKNKTARLAVIGLGYVGLPVACEFARAGFDVLGVELRQERVDQINLGHSPIEGNEPGLAELLAQVVANGNFSTTTEYTKLQDRDIILIDVETPVDENNTPRYAALRAVLRSLGPVLQPGALVIVESTLAPGTMDGVVDPELSGSSGQMVNKGFYLGHCPERVMPGKLLANLRSLSRVVGGMTPETTQAMLLLYRHVVQADLDPADCVTAELVKTTENAYRDVQIAFANEVALICEAVGASVWKVRELVNKSPYRQMHLPGAGVGGHCIPKDPWLLAYSAQAKDVPLRLIPAARMVNAAMPDHMVSLLQQGLLEAGCSLTGARILVLGYAYLEDSDDTRNSPSQALVDRLSEMGAEAVIHDPYVPGYDGDLLAAAQGCQAAIVMVRHRMYVELDLEALRAALQTPLLIDGRNVFDPERAGATGFIYRGVGLSPKA